MKLILASSSPRRKELLTLVGAEFEIKVSDIEEILDENLSLTAKIEKIAYQKAEHVAKTLDEKTDYLVLGSDTIVEVDGKILGKPKDEAEAISMISTLAGRKHNVVTAIALIPTNKNYKPVTAHQITEVKFKPLTEEEVKAYVASGESLDKAGAYAVQGVGIVIIEGIFGCYTNVVGLPIPLLNDVMKKHFNMSLL